MSFEKRNEVVQGFGVVFNDRVLLGRTFQVRVQIWPNNFYHNLPVLFPLSKWLTYNECTLVLHFILVLVQMQHVFSLMLCQLFVHGIRLHKTNTDCAQIKDEATLKNIVYL